MFYFIGVWLVIGIFLSIRATKMAKLYGKEIGQRMFFSGAIFNLLPIIHQLLTLVVAYFLWQVSPFYSILAFIVQPLIIGPIIRGLYDV